MEAKDIQKLLDFIANSGLDEVNIETEAFKVSTKRNSGKVIEQVYTQAAPQQVYAPQVQAALVAQAPAAAPAVAAPVADETSKYVTIKSPMIGTFYSSPKPEIDAFVSAGSDVSKGQVVCIIEAMKLFNEIESDISGRIVKVLVDNATPVEFDQPLFLVDPS